MNLELLLELFQYNGKFWPSMSSINVKSGDIFTIYASPTTKVVCLYYAWDNDDEIFTIEKVASNLRVPLDFEIGSTHWLRMSALFVNGESSEPEFFEFVIEENSNIPADEELNKKIHALNRIIEVPIDATLPINSYISIAPRYPVSVSPFYYWDDNEVIELKNTSVALPIEIPEDFEVNSEHTLTLYSVGEDGTSTIPKTYTIKFTEAVDEFATPISE